MIRGILPEHADRSEAPARCLMIYDWQRHTTGEWIELIEHVFATLGSEPAEGTGESDGARSHGAYKRVRNRLGGFLSAGDDPERSFSIRVRGPATHPGDDFFPADVCVSCSRSSTTRVNAASFAVRGSLVRSVNGLIEQIGKAVFELCGPCYGGAWDFPAVFGPEAYLASLGAVPEGYELAANPCFYARITRWRDNLGREGLRPSQGYFREIYPVNLVLDSHLRMPYRNAPMSRFMEAGGSLEPFTLCEGVYRWDLSEHALERFREALEPSGLVLSSGAKPLRVVGIADA